MTTAKLTKRVLLTGATGAVGRALLPRLVDGPWTVRCASRRPDAARTMAPNVEWVELDVDRPETVSPALGDCQAAIYLIHGMSDGTDYAERELRAAEVFAKLAAEEGLERIVYLGGMAPSGTPSDHLRSRLDTGKRLRSGPVPCVELRAGMVIGAGSISWQIVRDIAMRLPVQLLPAWLETQSQPIALRDVTAALEAALSLELNEGSRVYDVPGPETLSAREILTRVARLIDVRPVQVRLPMMSPRLSAHWLRLVTRADPQVARELVLGLAHDLVAQETEIWSVLPDYQRMSFDAAAQEALTLENQSVSKRALRIEGAIQRLARAIRP